MSQAPQHGNTTASGAMAPVPLDVLGMPLQGRQVIEASAGTGKTWTLAALYLRLVLGHGREGQALTPQQILVMTFTEAATAELRSRIRDRLAQAAAAFLQTASQPSEAAQVDGFLQQLRASYPEPEWPACGHRLALAAQSMDDAAIFTIHGWCLRMLREHAFESASLFEQAALEDGQVQRLAAAQDYWRQFFYPLSASAVAVVQGVASGPADLLVKIRSRWDAADRSPQDWAAPEPAHPWPAIEALQHWMQACEALETRARQAWSPDWRSTIENAAAGKALKNYRANHLPGWLDKMDAWQQGESISEDTLRRFTPVVLGAAWSGAPDLSALEPIQACSDHLAQRPDVEDALLDHATWYIRQGHARNKAHNATFEFNDLLQRLHQAVTAHGSALADTVRMQYPVALVDEFQDTDPWQYGILEKVYPAHVAEALLMIGDPKQAIYGFRGADLPTYLRARDGAQAVHSMDGNHRSAPELVAAINHVFQTAEQPFGADIAYQRVLPMRPQVQPLEDQGGRSFPAMTVWRLGGDVPLSADSYLQQAASGCAGFMTGLLNRQLARPGELAVLVRNGREADAIRSALGAQGVRSVYLSEKNSVYATQEAQDLVLLLRAMSQPRASAFLRSALATRSWGLEAAEIERLLHDEALWESLMERMLRWQATWRHQGLLPMLYQWLHEEGIAARLLGSDPRQGERRLTNLLQLGDLLQDAAQSLHGEAALLRYLETRLLDPGLGGESAQLRLESDEDLVKVVTMHKSKGLQYPLVFLPFIANFRSKEEEGVDAQERRGEDVRLLYVALTRAERGVWMCVAPRNGDFIQSSTEGKSALSRLLNRRSADDLDTRLHVWAQSPHIQVQLLPEPTGDRYRPVHEPAGFVAARQPRRLHRSRWWTASFSALARAPQAMPGENGARAASADWGDERWLDARHDSQPASGQPEDSLEPTPQSRWDAFPAGSAYGTLLHDLLEWQAREGWPLADETVRDPALFHRWQSHLQQRCDEMALPAGPRAGLEPWLRLCLSSSLPLQHLAQTRPTADVAPVDVQLHQLQVQSVWPEMAFTFPVGDVSAQELDAQITARLWPGCDRVALAPRQLGGMLTGFIDLVFEHQGRYHVLDYKSNRLPAYDPAGLERAVLDHRYDVQLVLYVLALHRLLRARLPDYSYERHVGGAVYFFLRGVEQPGAGVLHVRPPFDLIESLDRLLRVMPSGMSAVPQKEGR